jgi:hypothetical protein
MAKLCLAGYLYRASDADSTCIVLVYRPHMDFISLLRPKLRNPEATPRPFADGGGVL